MTLAVLAAKNVFRNKFRASLTIAGVAVAVVAFILLRTVIWSWTSAAEYAAKDRVVTRHKITFVMTLPKRYVDQVRATPGVKQATFSNWFGGKDPKHDREFFSTVAVETKTFFDVFPEMSVPREQMDAWLADRHGAIVGDVLAKKLGWKVGDKLQLTTGIYPGDWSFQIDGIYTATQKSIDRSQFVFHWDYLNDAIPLRRRDQIGWIVSRVEDPSRAAGIGVALDKGFEEKEIQTLSQDERAFNTSFIASMSAVLKAIDIVSIVILVIMMLVLGNTIAMGVRERTNEYGVLRAIGFLPRHVAMFIVSEAVLIGGIGGVLGLVLAYPIVERGMGRWIEENLGSFIPYFRIDTGVAILALALALMLGAVASAIPARRASKLSVVDALRRVG